MATLPVTIDLERFATCVIDDTVDGSTCTPDTETIV